MRRLLLVLVPVVTAAGCSLVDLTGYHGGALPDGADAAPDAGGTPPTDATTTADTSAADVQAEADAGDSRPAPCPSTDPSVVVCEDFESNAPPPSFGWTGSNINEVLANEPGIGRRGSRGIRAVQDGQGSSGHATSSGLWRDLDATFPVGRVFVIAFEFKLVTVGTYGFTLLEATVAGKAFGASVYEHLECPQGIDRPCVTWGNQFSDPMPWSTAFSATVGAWHHAEVTLRSTASGRTGVLAVDGRTVHQQTLTASTAPTSVVLFFGALFGQQRCEVVLDDFVVKRSDG